MHYVTIAVAPRGDRTHDSHCKKMHVGERRGERRITCLERLGPASCPSPSSQAPLHVVLAHWQHVVFQSILGSISMGSMALRLARVRAPRTLRTMSVARASFGAPRGTFLRLPLLAPRGHDCWVQLIGIWERSPAMSARTSPSSSYEQINVQVFLQHFLVCIHLLAWHSKAFHVKVPEFACMFIFHFSISVPRCHTSHITACVCFYLYLLTRCLNSMFHACFFGFRISAVNIGCKVCFFLDSVPVPQLWLSTSSFIWMLLPCAVSISLSISKCYLQFSLLITMASVSFKHICSIVFDTILPATHDVFYPASMCDFHTDSYLSVCILKFIFRCLYRFSFRYGQFNRQIQILFPLNMFSNFNNYAQGCFNLSLSVKLSWWDVRCLCSFLSCHVVVVPPVAFWLICFVLPRAHFRSRFWNYSVVMSHTVPVCKFTCFLIMMLSRMIFQCSFQLCVSFLWIAITHGLRMIAFLIYFQAWSVVSCFLCANDQMMVSKRALWSLAASEGRCANSFFVFW